MFFNSQEKILKIVSQWENIHLIKWQEISQTLEFWIEVINFNNATNENPFEDIADLALTALFLPFSNASIERTFSQMNYFKSKIRNRMSLKVLNAVLHIKQALNNINKCCRNIEHDNNVLKILHSSEKYTKMNYPLSLQRLNESCFDNEKNWDENIDALLVQTY